jgi:3-dehydroquinate synthase
MVRISRYNRDMESEPAIVPVRLHEHTYEITIQPGLLDEAGPMLRRLLPSRRAAVITDSQVGPLYLERLLASLREADFEPIAAAISSGEDRKTLQDLLPVYETLLRAGIERSTPVLALGGGVVGDMAGFVAATLLRGVPFVQVPTTLLAMVDASVGGKTGVNHPAGKNLIGAFHQPIAVMIDPMVLKSLPPRELRGGLAECIKHDIIRDAAGFDHLEQNIQRALDLEIDNLAALVAHNVAIKARVVEADPFENGERAHLNFGHTFGHAIETISQYSYSHGESVALGMCAAAALAVKLGMLAEPQRQRIVSVIQQAGLPTTGLRLDVDQVVSAMAFDKKVRSGRVRFVLPDRIGHVVIRDDVPPEPVRAAVEALR